MWGRDAITESPRDASAAIERIRRLPPLVLAAAALFFAALAGGLAALVAANTFGFAFPVAVVVAIIGGLAAGLGAIARMAPWWILILGLLPAAVAGAVHLDLPAWVFALLFVATALLYWNAGSERVPLYLTNRKTWRAIEGLVPKNAKRFVDLGSGLGGTLFHIARVRPDVEFVGIESAPVPYGLSWLRAKFSRLDNVTIRYGSLWKADLSTFDVAYAFLSPVPMVRLFEKVRDEMPSGTIFISNSFVVPGAEPSETVTVDDRRRTQLLIWRV